MNKVLLFFNRFSVGKNTSVRDLPDHEDPRLVELFQKNDVLLSDLNGLLEKEPNTSPNRIENNPRPSNVN